MSVLNPSQEQLSVLKEHYKDIILNWPEGYDFCEVCLIKEGMQQDDLIFCELCNGLVHQSCYGGELLDSIPENDWYCERCTQYIKDYINEQKLHDTNSIKCYFCPEEKGIVKKITIQHTGTQIWSHVGCVSSIKSLNFVDSTRTLIVQKYSPKRTTNECRICGLKTGNCGYCHTSGCNFTFHFSCGKRIGIIQDVTQMNTLMECREKQYKNSEPEHHVVFCEEHLYNLSYIDYPEDKFLKEFIQNMYVQRETFTNEGNNLSVLLPCDQKCEKIEYNKAQLQEKYQQKKLQLRKSKKTSSNSLTQSKSNIRDKSRSRSRSRSPPKNERKTAGGKKPRSSDLDYNEKESSKKPAQKSKAALSQSSISSKAPAKGKKEEESKSQQQNPTQAGKSKGGVSSSQSLSQNDKQNKSKVVASSVQSQNQQTQSKNEQQSNQSAPTQTKKQGKRGKNEDDQSNQLIENQDNWRRIQNVMQKYDYREKLLNSQNSNNNNNNNNTNNNNNLEEQKSNDEAFKSPFYILEELNKTLPKRTTVETALKTDEGQKSDQIEEKQVQTNVYDECSNSEFRDSSSNMMQMIEIDSTVLDQDKIIEEQKQSEIHYNYSTHISNNNNNNNNKDKDNKDKENKKFVVPIPKSSQSKELKDVSQSEDSESNSKKLQKKPNKLSDDEKSRVYKKFIMEYVKLNRNKLHGPQSLYIIHPEMMQIMQIQAALPQRKWKKEIAHFFVQKECLNPIQKEVQIQKCINQRIIDLFSDRNIPTNIPSKSFYKLFKAHFMIKVYDNVKQLSEFEDILETPSEPQENQENSVKNTQESQTKQTENIEKADVVQISEDLKKDSDSSQENKSESQNKPDSENKQTEKEIQMEEETNQNVSKESDQIEENKETKKELQQTSNEKEQILENQDKKDNLQQTQENLNTVETQPLETDTKMQVENEQIENNHSDDKKMQIEQEEQSNKDSQKDQEQEQVNSLQVGEDKENNVDEQNKETQLNEQEKENKDDQNEQKEVIENREDKVNCENEQELQNKEDQAVKKEIENKGDQLNQENKEMEIEQPLQADKKENAEKQVGNNEQQIITGNTDQEIQNISDEKEVNQTETKETDQNEKQNDAEKKLDQEINNKKEADGDKVILENVIQQENQQSESQNEEDKKAQQTTEQLNNDSSENSENNKKLEQV